MSMLLDDREDPLLANHLARFGLPLSTVRLDFGDLAISASNGWLIGYERKKLDDLVKSMLDRRLAGFQLRNMFKMYDRVELVIESVFRPGDGGSIEILGRNGWSTYFFNRSGISYRQLDSYLYSQYECGGVPCWRTASTVETAHLYASRYHWWQKDYDLHKSHDVIFSNEPTAQRRGAVLMQQGDPNPVTMLAAQIPGIDAKAWDVGKHFKSPYAMISAGVNEWRECPWTDRKGNIKHFGKDTARAIVQWLRGEKS